MRLGDDGDGGLDLDLELALLDAHLRELLVRLVELGLFGGDGLAGSIYGFA